MKEIYVVLKTDDHIKIFECPDMALDHYNKLHEEYPHDDLMLKVYDMTLKELEE